MSIQVIQGSFLKCTHHVDNTCINARIMQCDITSTAQVGITKRIIYDLINAVKNTKNNNREPNAIDIQWQRKTLIATLDVAESSDVRKPIGLEPISTPPGRVGDCVKGEVDQVNNQG